MKQTTPPDEVLKRGLVSNFEAAKSYDGKYVRDTIQKSDFTVLRKDVINKPSKLKKGDVLTTYVGAKKRPAVIIKVLKDNTVLYIPLTSTESVHCFVEYSSRFWGEGCFCNSYGVCTAEFALENFIGVFDNNSSLNKAIKKLKEYINQNL